MERAPLESSEVAAEEEFSTERAVESERGLFAKLQGRGKKIAQAFFLATALATGAGAVESAYAGEQTKAEDVEKKSPRERAIDLLWRLQTLPDNPAAVNQPHNESLKAKTARHFIFQFSLEKKLGFPESGSISGNVLPDDIREALKDLGVAGEGFADRFLGNNDGITDKEEMARFMEETQKNPGLRELRNMLQQFLR